MYIVYLVITQHLLQKRIKHRYMESRTYTDTHDGGTKSVLTSHICRNGTEAPVSIYASAMAGFSSVNRALVWDA